MSRTTKTNNKKTLDFANCYITDEGIMYNTGSAKEGEKNNYELLSSDTELAYIDHNFQRENMDYRSTPYYYSKKEGFKLYDRNTSNVVYEGSAHDCTIRVSTVINLYVIHEELGLLKIKVPASRRNQLIELFNSDSDYNLKALVFNLKLKSDYIKRVGSKNEEAQRQGAFELIDLPKSFNEEALDEISKEVDSYFENLK